jgi:hypothetical protein
MNFFILILLILILTGCGKLSTPLPASTIVSPTEIILAPTATNHPTQTPPPCPPDANKLLDPNDPENYIGKVFRFPHPNGIDPQFDFSVTDYLKYDIEYRLGFVINKRTSQQMFWLEREICRNPERKIFYEIIDTLILTLDLERQEVAVPKSCKFNGVFDPEIVAVGDRLPFTEKLENISQAWRGNVKTSTIEEISTNGIECYRESGIRAP